MAIRRVSAASAAAHVKVSKECSRARVLPPNPFQRAIGNRNSSPAASATCASSTFSAQPARQRSGTVVSARPPSALAENMPSLNALPPRSGCGWGAASLTPDGS